MLPWLRRIAPSWSTSTNTKAANKQVVERVEVLPSPPDKMTALWQHTARLAGATAWKASDACRTCKQLDSTCSALLRLLPFVGNPSSAVAAAVLADLRKTSGKIKTLSRELNLRWREAIELDRRLRLLLWLTTPGCHHESDSEFGLLRNYLRTRLRPRLSRLASNDLATLAQRVKTLSGQFRTATGVRLGRKDLRQLASTWGFLSFCWKKISV